ncbi:MAG: response regulator transcription factor [Spirochaetales bacterium]|nr:response regulator transcription factor [Spirochaetales bacterium]
MSEGRILVVEDEAKIANFIQKGLREEGYTVEVASDGEQGLRRVLAEPFDLMVLDLTLPEMDGLEVCRTVRDKGLLLPVVMLTARDGVEDKVRGLDIGADDYVTKPFEFEEFLARVRSHLRKSRQSSQTVLHIADLVLDTRSRRVERGGRLIELSLKEMSLLQFLMEHQGEVLSRLEISERVWDIHFDTTTNVIDVHINRLRKKVDYGYTPQLIHTVRGAGYMLKEE